MSASGDSPWFRYFPENYLWSHVFCHLINLASLGGTTLWEVDQVGHRLKDKVGDADAWNREWEWMADRVFAYAEEEEKKGHAQTAAAAFIRSALYRFSAERLLHPEDPRKAESYQKTVVSYERGMRTKVPGFERVEVPYEEGPMPAYWIPPREARGKAPAVVFFDGLDASKETAVLWGGLALRERNIGVLCVDGPGQGEMLRLRNVPSRHDYEVPAGAAFDCVSARPEVDPERIGLMALSMGGYYAPRAAAFEHRYAACAAWGIHYDYHASWVERRKSLESGGSRASSAMWQLPWVMGRPDMDSAMEKCEAFTLEGVLDKIKMPILFMNGNEDVLAPEPVARRAFEECGSQEKELKLFTVEDGGCQHCLLDNSPLASNYIADWWEDRLWKKP